VRAVRLFIVVAVLAAAGGGVWWYLTRPNPVTVAMPTRGEAAEIVYATGVVEPLVWAKVTSLVRERIVEICDCEGDAVDAGAVLARLNDREARAALSELQARLRLAREERDRQEALSERNVSSRQALDRARAEVAQNEAALAGQTARLEQYVLRAPTAGTVLRRDGEVGEIADSGDVLFWVGRPKPLVVIADVNEEDIPRIVVGQRALLRADAFPERALEAEVERITPKGDPVSKTYRVRFALPDDTPLMIGMSVDVNVVVRVSPDALLVPTLAVRENALFVAEGDRARRRDIRAGIRGVRDVEILSGIDERTRVIVPFPEALDDGARIAVVTE